MTVSIFMIQGGIVDNIKILSALWYNFEKEHAVFFVILRKKVCHGLPCWLLPVLGTVCPSMSHPHPQCFLLQAFLPMTLCSNFCGACTVTVVIFGHLNRSFFFLAYFHSHVHQWCVCVLDGASDTSAAHPHSGDRESG